MSVGLELPENLLSINGTRLAAISAGIYSNKRDDLVLIELNQDSVTSAVFTQNLFCAAPVQIAKKNISNANPRYLLINSGNANAGTGRQGMISASDTCQALASITSCDSEQVIPFSTGVIGEDLPVDKIKRVLPELVKNLSDNNWLDAAKAIMTTDTIPKAISTEVNISGVTVNITGIAKGSGMIKPNMATMLSFIATDAYINKEIQNEILFNAINKSFNRITVDGDTSTNDACVISSTGKANNELIDRHNNDGCIAFENAITDVCSKLAQSIVRDGEGATKFISILVSEGKNTQECLNVAYKIAGSPLVKTAFTASDPNWGRILAAVGNSDIPDLNIDKVNVYLDDVCIVENGQRSVTYTELQGKEVMSQDEIKLSVKLNRGSSSEEIWTTDLSHEYITINAEYRT